ncbi:hypothetical protein G3N56_03560 [Desulfovibrio sulfodismutans]|uniref:Uncharacterized protein n=1 Tax=Desulfolutivibrio sulfodismutans TaxID=63561 RepID=A0A7K3NKT5_9BACT|nr:hypothetical protein [Desulfolutivibrio sulfodismutans]NDY55819.1 hypothetical protein [Desulfolutivibrio sulfodismutans]QLA14223.1 hypothetical protein GD606_19100 [Desulfolutivibrio sulfodismutans DSM 3696]
MDTYKKLPKIKDSGISKIKGKDIASYEAKLDFAHQVGIKSLEVKITQFPAKGNGQTCICDARLETDDGKVFADIGDANPNNVPQGCVDNFIRMASTRAKARVLSDAFNIRSVMEEDSHTPQNDLAWGQIIDVDFTDVPSAIFKSLPAAHDGGGSKPASDKQLGLIAKMAKNQSVSPEDVAIKMFHKPFNQLKGSEASTMIKHLMIK